MKNSEIKTEVNVVKNEKPEVRIKKKAGLFKKLAIGASVASAMASMTATTALAGGFDGGDVAVGGGDLDAGDMMGKIIGILLTITRYVGVALIIYGIYEIVMSFMQNQPEAKTKGIIMALAGVVMVALKSVLKGMSVIS